MDHLYEDAIIKRGYLPRVLGNHASIAVNHAQEHNVSNPQWKTSPRLHAAALDYLLPYDSSLVIRYNYNVKFYIISCIPHYNDSRNNTQIMIHVLVAEGSNHG